jgi:hypothetical protein
MAKFTLFEPPSPGDEIPDPATNSPRKPGDDLLIIDRVLVDRKGRQRGTMTVRGTILRTFTVNDALWALQGHYKLQKGVINTQSGSGLASLPPG